MNSKRGSLTQVDLLLLAYFKRMKQFSSNNTKHVNILRNDYGFVDAQLARSLKRLSEKGYIILDNKVFTIVKSKDVKKENVPVVYPFQSEAFLDKFDEYLDHRANEKKKPFKTQESIQRCLNSLYEMSGGNEKKAYAILKATMDNNWLGLQYGKQHIEAEQPTRIKGGSPASIITKVDERFEGFSYGDGNVSAKPNG